MKGRLKTGSRFYLSFGLLYLLSIDVFSVFTLFVYVREAGFVCYEAGVKRLSCLAILSIYDI